MVRDAGDPHGLALEAARHANARPDRFAAVLPAGEPVYRRGRYGGFLGAGVESATDAAALLVRNRDAGATHAKVLATGLNSLDRAGAAGPPQFCRDELAEIAAAATSLGLPLMVHANGPLGDVIAARPASVEHGFGCTAADRLRLGEPGISWVPTLGAWAELAGPPQLPPKQAAVVAATDREQRHAVAHGHRAGVALAAGSDAGCPGVPHGQGLLREIGRLAHAGLPPAAALATASAAARELCQRELGRPLGGLSPGGPAGFVWLAGDPVAAPATLDAPLGVYLGGCWSPAPAPPPHREA